MQVDIIGTAAEVNDDRVRGHNVAVIDVFRATSVMVTALSNGAREIIPVTGVEESFTLRDKIRAQHTEDNDNNCVLLGGERKTLIIEGFDLDNSPLKYSSEIVHDSTIIMSTTNGTRAVNCAQGAANEIYIAALLNADAVSKRLGELGTDVSLICAGRHDRFTIEDGLCAGMMARYLGQEYGYTLTDFAWMCVDMYERWADDLRGALDHCEHYHNIKDRWTEDIAYCLQRNVLDTTPHVTKNGSIRL